MRDFFEYRQSLKEAKRVQKLDKRMDDLSLDLYDLMLGSSPNMTKIANNMLKDQKQISKSQGESPKEKEMKDLVIDLINQDWDQSTHIYDFGSKFGKQKYSDKSVWLLDRKRASDFSEDLRYGFDKGRYLAILVPKNIMNISKWNQLSLMKWSVLDTKFTKKDLMVLEDWFGKGGGEGN